MRVLPLQTLRHDEGFIYGSSHADLANLHHHGFPVAKGFVVLPPESEIQSILKKHHIETSSDLEHREQSLKKDFFAIPFHDELNQSQIVETGLDPEIIWQDLLKRWFYEVQSKITRQELKHFKKLTLSPQTVFVLKKIESIGVAYFDPKQRQVIIDVEEGNPLSLDQIDTLDTLVVQANKKLLLPKVYHWVLEEGKIYFMKLKPFTEKLSQHEKELETFSQLKTIIHQKKTLKLFQDISQTFTVAKDADGFLVTANTNDLDKTYSQLAEKDYFLMNEVATSFPALPVLYKLSFSNLEDLETIRNQANLFLSLRNLKQHLNLQLIIPTQLAADNVLTIKRELASLGISRKGSLKIWLEIGTAENILAIEKYIETGIDGVVIDLDRLYRLLNGYNLESAEVQITPEKTKLLFEFLEGAIKLLHKADVSILLQGQLAKTDQAINFSVKKGIFGILSDLGENAFITEHIQFVEKTHFSNL